ncbi:PREDICTED: uncharacterized protein LOC109167064 [Ipomoea nil]|uniref:uncharacterized protein LOC109167064 n=1 Tax=Ipomoea nil TaxID=35883 RepID=UPI000901906F|nr:PREDICTED: uncharacterized protein LOC109167064 [Ipomoea nil]
MLYRASSIGSRVPADNRMSGGASAPVEVGTRGTIGSLLKKEIEYFRKLEMEFSCGGSPLKPQSSVGGGSSSSWPGFGFLMMLKWKKKKRRVSGGGGLQSVCSLVDVSDTHRMNEIRGFSYVNLKVDSKRFQEQTVVLS